MKLLSFFTLSVAFSLRLSAQPIIDTTFSEGNAQHIPLGQQEIASASEFPLKYVTSTGDVAMVEDPSTFVISTEAKKGMKPPFALVSLKPKLPENQKPNEYPFATVGLGWKFQRAALGPGSYQATWTFVPLSPVRSLKMAFVLMGENPDGTLGKIEIAVSPNEVPLWIIASGDKLAAGDESVPMKDNKPNEIVVDFDLTKNTWSAKINGKSLIKNKVFPKDYFQQYPKFRVVGFGIGGGAIEDMTGAEYAVGPVKLVKLN